MYTNSQINKNFRYENNEQLRCMSWTQDRINKPKTDILGLFSNSNIYCPEVVSPRYPNQFINAGSFFKKTFNLDNFDLALLVQ